MLCFTLLQRFIKALAETGADDRASAGAGAGVGDVASARGATIPLLSSDPLNILVRPWPTTLPTAEPTATPPAVAAACSNIDGCFKIPVVVPGFCCKAAVAGLGGCLTVASGEAGAALAVYEGDGVLLVAGRGLAGKPCNVSVVIISSFLLLDGVKDSSVNISKALVSPLECSNLPHRRRSSAAFGFRHDDVRSRGCHCDESRLNPSVILCKHNTQSRQDANRSERQHVEQTPQCHRARVVRCTEMNISKIQKFPTTNASNK
ncbi:hypothetical protein GQX74_005215 [Glossina fuscipes]|nr:hypothetical protein GQX74_005215 [Glossina fuscipes]